MATKRFVVYYDEGLTIGPKVEIKDGNNIADLFSEDLGWGEADRIRIGDMVVNESIYSSQSGVTFTVMIWRVK